MSKLFHRLNSLIKYLKYKNLLDVNYESFIFQYENDKVIIDEYSKLIKIFDDVNNDLFKDVYISFMNEYYDGLIDNIKREKANYAKIRLLDEYRCINGNDSKPTDKYIYENINLPNDLKPYLNLSIPFIY